MTTSQPNNPLHGKRLDTILEELLVHYRDWEGLAAFVDIKCFKINPNMKSSLNFLRKTPWAREKVEALYLQMLRNKA
jgi:uncharacterized protein (DUF2132 family)